MATSFKTLKPLAEQYPPLEAGTYPARCVGVIDLGEQWTDYQGHKQIVPQISLVFQIPSETIEIKGEKMQRRMALTRTFSNHPSSKLRQNLEMWRGRKFTEEELVSFELSSIIGAPCVLTVTHTSNDKPKISAISRAGKSINVPEIPSKDFFLFDIEDETSWDSLKQAGKWVWSKLNESVTFTKMGYQVDEYGEIVTGISANDKLKAPSESDFTDIDDIDDLPF